MPTALTAPPPGAPTGDPAVLAEQVAAAVIAHPAVARLHGGPFGAIATHLPGRRLVGVRIGTGDQPVEIGVALRADRPIPEVVAELRRSVADLSGGAPVDVTVADIELPAARRADPAAAP